MSSMFSNISSTSVAVSFGNASTTHENIIVYEVIVYIRIEVKKK